MVGREHSLYFSSFDAGTLRFLRGQHYSDSDQPYDFANDHAHLTCAHGERLTTL